MTAAPSRGREGPAQRGKVPLRGTLKRTSPYGHSGVKVDPWLFSSRVTGNVGRRCRKPPWRCLSGRVQVLSTLRG